MSYAVADGFNNGAGLQNFVLQPKQPNGITYPEQVYGGDLNSGFIGTPSTILLWTNTMERDIPATILAQAGLNNNFGSEVSSNDVTLRILDNDDSWIIVNATIHTPRENERFYIGWNQFALVAFIRGLAAT